MNLLDRIQNLEFQEVVFDTGHGAWLPRRITLTEHNAQKVALALADALEAAEFRSMEPHGEGVVDWIRKEAEPRVEVLVQHEMPLLFPLPALDEPDFDGPTIEPEHDQKRLGKQLRRVLQALIPGDRLTLAEIRERTQDPEASISARIRDLRKPKFGGHTVTAARRGDPGAGVWEYWMEV